VLFAGKLSLSRFYVLLRRARDASVMLFGVRDRETHSVDKRLSRSLDFRSSSRSHAPYSHFELQDKFYARAGDTIARVTAIAIAPPFQAYCGSPAQLTWLFQSTNGPWGLSRHAQTCSSKNAGRP
jgi:hypothetical protein